MSYSLDPCQAPQIVYKGYQQTTQVSKEFSKQDHQQNKLSCTPDKDI